VDGSRLALYSDSTIKDSKASRAVDAPCSVAAGASAACAATNLSRDSVASARKNGACVAS